MQTFVYLRQLFDKQHNLSISSFWLSCFPCHVCLFFTVCRSLMQSICLFVYFDFLSVSPCTCTCNVSVCLPVSLCLCSSFVFVIQCPVSLCTSSLCPSASQCICDFVCLCLRCMSLPTYLSKLCVSFSNFLV